MVGCLFFKYLLACIHKKSLLKGKVITERYMSGPWVTRFTGHISWPVLFVRTGPSGSDGEGKETQHSFKELDLLCGNNSHGRKTRMKITTSCSGTQEGYNSFTSGCFMFILGNTEETCSPEVLPFFSSFHLQSEILLTSIFRSCLN